MTTPKTTPTPWTTEAAPHRAWICRIGNNHDDPEIWSKRQAQPGETYQYGDKAADAALIVQAVNSHAELVEALKRVATLKYNLGHPTDSHLLGKAIEIAEAALAHVEQKD